LPLKIAAPKSLRISITNVYGGDYTAKILVGKQKKPANVILDTGSSTLAVKPTAYDPAGDTPKRTSLAQVVLYGTGGWAGPVLETSVTLGGATLPAAPVALTAVAEPNNFGAADGILGLAYNALNDAFDLGTYLEQKGVNPPDTYPWPLHIQGTEKALETFESSLPATARTSVDPYFTDLEEQNIVANKLAFYTLRSIPRVSDPNATPAKLAEDKLNQGYLILGGGEEEKDLFEGGFTDVAVVDDLYYNVNLKGVRIGNGSVVPAAALQPKFHDVGGSNAIVDSGTNSLFLAPDVFVAILGALEKANPKFIQLLRDADQSQDGVAVADLKLETWPDLVFVLQGKAGDVELTVSPSTYWQTDFPAPGRAFPVLGGQQAGPNTPNQSILGLPLMNNYYTIFDRSVDANGIIRFAKIKPPA
jgi:hypothetical protein